MSFFPSCIDYFMKFSIGCERKASKRKRNRNTQTSWFAIREESDSLESTIVSETQFYDFPLEHIRIFGFCVKSSEWWYFIGVLFLWLLLLLLLLPIVFYVVEKQIQAYKLARLYFTGNFSCGLELNVCEATYYIWKKTNLWTLGTCTNTHIYMKFHLNFNLSHCLCMFWLLRFFALSLSLFFIHGSFLHSCAGFRNIRIQICTQLLSIVWFCDLLKCNVANMLTEHSINVHNNIMMLSDLRAIWPSTTQE